MPTPPAPPSGNYNWNNYNMPSSTNPPYTGGQYNWDNYNLPGYTPTPSTGGGGGGGGGAAPPSGPNPGDFNANGDRWDPVSGQWLNPGFFSDLSNPGGGGGGGGGGATGGGMGVPPPPGQAPGGPLVQPQQPGTPGGYPGIEIPEQLLEYIPENLRAAFAQQLSPFLSQYGFRGLGNIGRYGERSFGRAGGSGPIGFTPEMFNFFTDPTMRSWYQWLFGERGFTPERTSYPGAAA